MDSPCIKQTVCKVLKILQHGKYLVAYVLKNLLFSSLPAKIKKNQSKMKELEWSKGFPYYNPMGGIFCYGNQSSDPI